MKAVNASRLAITGKGAHFASRGKVIRMMKDTGRDMHTNYKESSRVGLAVSISEY